MNWLVNSINLLVKGGPVMVPLMFCSVVAVAILIERNKKLRSAINQSSSQMQNAKKEIDRGNWQKAIELLEKVDTPVSRVLSSGLKCAHLDERCVERAMEEQGTKEIDDLSKRVGYLDTIITIAPLLGLLGTVTGMISAFNVIATKEGISTPTAITGGVAEALIATATGLAIAIVTLIGYNSIQEKIKGVVSDIETNGTALVNVIAEASEEKHEIKSLSA